MLRQRHRGLIVAVHTPFFTDGRLNLDVVAAQAELLQAAGVAGVFAGGTTGESHSLTVEERMQLATRWVDVAAGTSLAVFIHVGHNCLADAQTLARHAEQIGANAIAALAPTYFKPPTLDELVACCGAIAAAAPELPFYYYDIPSMTGLSHSMPRLLELARQRIPTMAGLKYTNSDLVQLQECLAVAEDDFEILFGSDEILLAALSLGVEGAVGSTYNLAAPLYHDLIRAFATGDLKTAQQLQRQSVQMVRTLQSFGFPAAAKTALKLLGVDLGPVRLPLANLSEADECRLLEQLAALGVLGPLPTAEPSGDDPLRAQPATSAKA